jgi:hypothetical protein
MKIDDLAKVWNLFLLASLLLGFLLGVLFHYSISPDQKSRSEICAAERKQIDILKTQITKSEESCFVKIDQITKQVTAAQETKCLAKTKRLEDACNQLDCLQCRRK